MDKKTIAKAYIRHLQAGNLQKLIALFTEKAIVHSPIYGIQPAKAFYTTLSEDTKNSKLSIKGIFEDDNANSLALYFNYQWTLKNGKLVEFDVVDILDFDEHNKIIELKIIYDTVIARQLVLEL